MNKIILLLFCCFLSTSIFSQKTTNSDYFQQEVNYKIDVTLDDVNHLLIGDMTIEYVNNSPDALDQIFFHLWANAYQSQTTAFAKQQIQNGYSEFFFAKFESISLHVGDQAS